MTSQGNFPKSTDTGVNSLTPVAENYPRVEALTSLSGLMCIVSSNPDNRFPQKFNEKNSPSREVISFKSGQIRHTVHLFVEKFEKWIKFFSLKHCWIFKNYWHLIVKLSIKVKLFLRKNSHMHATSTYTFYMLNLFIGIFIPYKYNSTTVLSSIIHQRALLVLILNVHVIFPCNI